MGITPDATSGFGQRVLQARLNMAARLGRQVTQQEIADAMGVQQGTVGRWEKGIKEPDLKTISRLAAILEVDPRWLAFGGDNPFPVSPPTVPSWPADVQGKPASPGREAKRRRRA